MLKDPPCIPPLLGCSDADRTTRSSSSSSSVGMNSTNSSSSSRTSSTSSSSSSSRTSSMSSSSSSSRSVSITSSASGTGFVSPQAERLAVYTINVANKGTAAVNGFAFTHGPIPTGALFDSFRSSKGCTQVGSDVQCTLDLGPNDVQNVHLVYIVNHSVSCEIERPLQSVQPVSTTTGTSVTTSVACAVSAEASAASSSVSSSFSSVSPVITGTQQSSSGSVFTGSPAFIVTQPEDGAGKDYKPSPSPRTGAVSDYFAGTKSASLLRVHPSETGSDGFPWNMGIVFLPMALVMTIAGLAILRNKTRRILMFE